MDSIFRFTNRIFVGFFFFKLKTFPTYKRPIFRHRRKLQKKHSQISWFNIIVCVVRASNALARCTQISRRIWPMHDLCGHVTLR